MFNEIASKALPHVDKLTIILTGTADSMTVAIIADPKKGGVKVQPITMKGSATEIDEALPQALEQVFGKNEGLLTNVQQVADQAAKEAEEKLKANAAKANAAATSGKKVVNSSILKGDEKKAWDKIQEHVRRAKESIDKSMVSFLQKGALDEAKKIKSQPIAVKEVTEVFATIVKELDTKLKAAPPADGLFAAPAETTQHPAGSGKSDNTEEVLDEDQDEDENDEDEDEVEETPSATASTPEPAANPVTPPEEDPEIQAAVTKASAPAATEEEEIF